MPFYKSISLNSDSTLYLWKITEDVDLLRNVVILKEESLIRLQQMKSISHQKGFLAVRMLLQHLGYSDHDLYYDDFGKPHLNAKFEKKNINISISHSFEYSAIAISSKNIGIDIELLKPKTLTIASRFMDVSHLKNLSELEQLQKATVIWGIKESIFKIKSEKGISFPDHIFEDSFDLKDKKATAQLHFENKIESFSVVFAIFDNYVYVCAWQQ
jgi:phosphopantetheinyl transferase